MGLNADWEYEPIRKETVSDRINDSMDTYQFLQLTTNVINAGATLTYEQPNNTLNIHSIQFSKEGGAAGVRVYVYDNNDNAITFILNSNDHIVITYPVVPARLTDQINIAHNSALNERFSFQIIGYWDNVPENAL